MIMEWYRGEGAGMDEVSHSVYSKKTTPDGVVFYT